MRFRWNLASRLAVRGLGPIAMLLLGACAGTAKPVSEIRPTGARPTVYVVHHGALHTGLAVKQSDIPRGAWPASADFADSKYIEVGWGDDDGYRKPLTSGTATKALLGDRQTVLLANGFNQSPARKFGDPKFTVLAVDLSEAGFARLCDHIEQTYAADENGAPIRLGAGWYRARGTYSAFNTCNTWVAAGLHKAGCPISPVSCLTAGQLLERVRPFARVVSTRR